MTNPQQVTDSMIDFLASDRCHVRLLSPDVVGVIAEGLDDIDSLL
ncbi:MAG: hypothetical protein RLZZ511_394 [Cyanobacteriota bacterium]|jgi:hypothetical protein